jgi:hypothetical protein
VWGMDCVLPNRHTCNKEVMFYCFILFIVISKPQKSKAWSF